MKNINYIIIKCNWHKYKNMHDLVEEMIYWEMCKLNFDLANKWYIYRLGALHEV